MYKDSGWLHHRKSLLKLAILAVLFIFQLTHTANNGVREIEFGPLDGGKDDEYNDVGFMKIS